MRLFPALNRLFLLWVILFSVAAWFFPELFTGLRFLINPGLGLIMLGMGIGLTPGDFSRIIRDPRPVLIGIMLQFICMPCAAWIISVILGFDSSISSGFVLLGACPGGTASNVIVFLSGGNVALSVTMTTFSTLLSPLATPWITQLLASKWIHVPVARMFLSILLIIVLPVMSGMVLHRILGNRVKRAVPFFQFLSVITIAFIIALILAINRQSINPGILYIFAGVILHNGAGLALGYGIPRLFRINRTDAMTIGIEVGMQNSGLAVKLALDFFTPAAALPGALFSLWHNITGAVISFSRRKHSGL